MNYWQRFRQSSVTNQIMSLTSVAMALVTIGLLVAAGMQYWATAKMLGEMQSSSEDTRKLAQAAVDQANAAQRQAEQMSSQSNTMTNTLDEMRRSVNAAQSQADAAAIAANAMQSQADASRVAADAAKKSADVSADTFSLSERPFVGVSHAEIVDMTLGKKIALNITLKNTGRTPALEAKIQTHLMVGPEGTDQRTCPVPKPHKIRGGTGRLTIPVNAEIFTTPLSEEPQTSEEIMHLLREGKWLIYVYGIVRYSDNRRMSRRYSTTFYFQYDASRDTFAACDTNNYAN